MIRRIISYLVAMVGLLLLSMLYSHEIVIGIIAFLLCYAVLSFLLLVHVKRRLKLSLGCVVPIAQKNSEIDIPFLVNGTNKILGQRVELTIKVHQQMLDKASKVRIPALIEANQEDCIHITFQSSYCGNVTLKIKDIRLYDLLGFFYIKKKCKEQVTIGVLPPYHLLLSEISQKTREYINDGEEYTPKQSGDDPSEIFQIREYRSSDPIHAIHWKLTAKEGRIMVKEHGYPIGCVVLLWIDLVRFHKVTKEEVNRLLEVTASISMTLCEEEVIHMVAWFEPSKQRIVKRRVAKEEQVYELLHRLLVIESYDASQYHEEYFMDAFKGMHFSSKITVDLQGSVCVNGEEKISISTKNVKKELQEFILSV